MTRFLWTGVLFQTNTPTVDGRLVADITWRTPMLLHRLVDPLDFSTRIAGVITHVRRVGDDLLGLGSVEHEEAAVGWRFGIGADTLMDGLEHSGDLDTPGRVGLTAGTADMLGAHLLPLGQQAFTDAVGVVIAELPLRNLLNLDTPLR